LPEASSAVNVAVTFSPAVGASGENVSVTVFAVTAPTTTATVDVIFADAQAAVSHSVIVALPDLTPVTTMLPAPDVAGTVAIDVSDEVAKIVGAAVLFAALSAPVTVIVEVSPTPIDFFATVPAYEATSPKKVTFSVARRIVPA
jgi:hypothetical protein